MSFGVKVNNMRRRLMHKLTQNIGHSGITDTIVWSNGSVKRVLICRPNSRLGNQLLITPLVEEISEIFPNCKIDLFVRGGLSPILFQNYKNVDRIIKLPKKPFKELFGYLKVWVSLRKYRYDMVINVDKNSSSGRLSTQFSNGRIKLFNDSNEDLQAKYKDYNHIAKFPVYNLRKYLSLLGLNLTDRPLLSIDLKLSAEELDNGKKILDNIVSREKKTIALYTYATRDKCYSKEWWTDTFTKIKDQYGATYNILEVLPIENVSQINFEAPTYYSKDIREIGSVIANCLVFIGADSGIMHLSVASKTPTIGLFSVTDIEKYRPYNNKSIAVNTNTTTLDDLMKEIDNVIGLHNQ